MRLTESPDLIRLPGGALHHDHPSSWTFCVLNSSIVATSRRTHPFIFNALHAVSEPDKASPMVRGTLKREGPQGVYDDYGVKFFPQDPDSDTLEWVRSIYTGEMGEMRRRTKSGRLWKSVEMHTGKPRISALSFWCTENEVKPQDIQLLIAAFKLESPIYIEYIDSISPVLHGSTPQKHKNFDSEKVINALVKAHVAGTTLSPEEKAIVNDFRGVDDREAKARSAEFNAFRTIGDSVEEGLSSYSPPADPTLLFFDFYCLYTLAYKYGDLFGEYHPDRTGEQSITHFRISEAINEAFYKVKQRVRSLMLKNIPLVCLEEALRLNNTSEFDLEDMHAELVAMGLHKNDPRVAQYVRQYVEKKTPELGGKVNAFIAGVLTLALRHASVASNGSVIYMSEFVPDQDVGGLIRLMGGRIDMPLLETIFTLHWLPDHGGSKWFRICELIRKLQESKTMKNEVFYIDMLYDVEHNTGSLLEKIPALWVPKEDLDTRFLIRNTQEFLPHISDQCRKIALAVERTR